jgi:hypothetical protein
MAIAFALGSRLCCAFILDIELVFSFSSIPTFSAFIVRVSTPRLGIVPDELCKSTQFDNPTRMGIMIVISFLE